MLPDKEQALLADLDHARRQIQTLRQELISQEFSRMLGEVKLVKGAAVLGAVLKNADADTLRQMTDEFRQQYPSGAVVLGQ